MKYVLVRNGEIIQFYSKDVHGDNIPKQCIKISDDEWMDALKTNANRYSNINGKNYFYYSNNKTVEQSRQEIIKDIKTTRANLLSRVDDLVMNPFRFEELSETEVQELRQFRRELLDITEHPDFPNVLLPDVPEILK